MAQSPRSLKFKPFQGHNPSKFRGNSLSKPTCQEDCPSSSRQVENNSSMSSNPVNSCPVSPVVKPRKSFNSSVAFSTISDFHNKEQVGRAIDLVNTLHNRVQVVDLILKRRNEIQEMENQMKLAKAGPIIKGLVSDFRKRIKKKEQNKSHGQFRKSLFSLFSQEGQYITNEQNSIKPLETACDSFNQESEKTSVASAREHKFSAWVEPVTSQTPRLEPLKANFIPPPPNSSRLDGERPSYSIQSQFAKNQIPSLISRTNEETFSLANKTNPASIFFKRNKLENNQSGIDWGTDFNTKESLATEENTEKEVPKQRKLSRRKITASSYELGKETFQKELCKYLLKHENKDSSYQDVVLNLGKAKQPKIKSIETDVKAKFEALAENKKPSSYFLRNSVSHRKNLSEPIRSKVFQQDEYKTVFRNNIKIRRSGEQAIHKQPENLKKNAEGCFEVDDESFVSFTETQLDHLYRQTHKLKNTLKVLDNKLDHTEPLKQWRKLEKTKGEKLNDLYQNSGEIMKVTHKKLIS